MSTTDNPEQNSREKVIEYVTFYVGEQLFGLPIDKVQDVFLLGSMTQVPLSSPEIAGVLNLRGRIVTAIDMHLRLNIEDTHGDKQRMAVGVDYKNEAFCLLVDNVGEVLKLNDGQLEANPANLHKSWNAISAGVCRLEKQLMVVLDVERVIQSCSMALAA